MKTLTLIFLLVWPLAVYADYVEVRRNAHLYTEASRHSTSLILIDPDEYESPPQFMLARQEQVNGYYEINWEGRTAWIYRSLVRKYSGIPEGELLPNYSDVTGEEMLPDFISPEDFDQTEITDTGLDIYVFDLGQADSMLILGPDVNGDRRSLLVDLGENVSGAEKTNHRTVKQRIFEITGEYAVDYMIITHFHQDHVGYPGRGNCAFYSRAPIAPNGLFALLADDNEPFRIGTLFDRGESSDQFTPKIALSHCGIRDNIDTWIANNRVGQRLVPTIGTTAIDLGGNVTVEFVAVDGKVHSNDEGALAFAQSQRSNLYHSRQSASQNDYSLTFELSLGNFEFFSGGDLTGSKTGSEDEVYSIRRFGDSSQVYTNVESYMVDYWDSVNRESNVEVYRVNHHGSDHSSNNDLADALSPEVVIYSTKGDYGHPAKDVVRKFWYADQYITTAASTSSWPNGFPEQYGSVEGEIHIKVSQNGDRYQVNDWIYRSLSDDEESQ